MLFNILSFYYLMENPFYKLTNGFFQVQHQYVIKDAVVNNYKIKGKKIDTIC